MIRLILSCLVAMLLIGSAPAIAAMTSPQLVEDCEMAGGVPNPTADHSKMACCTNDCTVMGMAALVQPDSTDVSLAKPTKPLLNLRSVKILDSLGWATVDPPPRLHSS